MKELNVGQMQGSIAVGVILIVIVVFSVLPIRISDKLCYVKIVKDECGSRELNFYNYDINHVYGTSYNFKCCDYTKINNESRRVSDTIPNCISYNFINRDHKLCSKTYKYWKTIS